MSELGDILAELRPIRTAVERIAAALSPLVTTTDSEFSSISKERLEELVQRCIAAPR